MSRRWIFGGAWLLATVPCATAGVNTWTAAGPQGGEVREIVMHPVDPDIAVTIAYSGVYRTTNGGVSWTRASHDFQNPPYDLEVDPSDPNRVYVFSIGFPVITSADGGVTFQPMANPPAQGAEPRLALAAGGVMYYAAGLRVSRSHDRGASWFDRTAIQAPVDAHIRSIFVDSADTAVYVIVGSSAIASSLFVSRDGAASWTRLADYDYDHNVFDLVLHPANAGQVWARRADGVWRSDDYGATWTNVHFAQLVYDIALSMRGADVQVDVASYEGVFRSTNGGDTWTDITGDLATTPRLIAAHPIYPDRVMVGDFAGISVPGPSPGTWVSRHQGIVAAEVYALEVDSASDRIYAHSAAGVHASAGGAEFLPTNNRQLANIGSPPLPKLLTAIHAQPANLLALLSEELAQSTDGGATWTLIPGYPANRQEQLYQLESSRADPRNLIVVGTESLRRSSDGGATWMPVTAGLPADYSAYDFELADSDSSVVYLSPYSPSSIVGQAPPSFGVYRSNDGGSSWVAANAGIQDVAVYDIEIDPSDAQVVYAATWDSLLKSTNGGATWRTLLRNLKANVRIGIDPTRPRIVYVVHAENIILRSVNGGELFETLRSHANLPWWSPRAVVVDPIRSSVVNVGTGGFGVQQMSIEPDLELTWSSAPTSASIGAAASYVVTVKNRGPYASSGGRVTIQFPSGATGVTASTQSGSCTLLATSAQCIFNALILNASGAIAVSATPEAAGSFIVSATVEGDQPDVAPSNNAASHSVVVSPSTPPSTTPGAGSSGGGAATPAPQPITTPAAQPATSSGGGGGGGGALLVLLAIAAVLRRAVAFGRERAGASDRPIAASARSARASLGASRI